MLRGSSKQDGHMADRRGRRPRYHHGDLREALLAAAEQELVDKGIEGFTLRGAAKRAGVSHAAPAHHFRDTRDLLTALAAVAANRFYRSMKDRQENAEKTPRAQFVALGLGYVEFALASPALFGLMFGSKRPDYAAAELSKPASDAFRLLVDDIAALRDEDPLATPDGRADIAAAWALVHGLAELLIAGRLGFLKQDLEGDLECAILRVINHIVPGGTAAPAAPPDSSQPTSAG
ncbi:TetR family transcriptional regulator [Mesorhizobium ephedrae]|uniref:TetR family transcriptional regulator n=2 Tax=Kumtagia ephedrae TaxID=2116701 RepID=A0A2P7SLK8_9HYPH|nr:TetR family transcriptional regulator [Mesorhizobium ephedrae]